MIRRAIILCLCLGAVVSAAGWVFSIGWKLIYTSGFVEISIARGGLIYSRDFWRGASGSYTSTLYNFDGIAWQPYFSYGGPGIVELFMPLWVLFVSFLAYPVIAFVNGRLRRWRRRRAGLCVKCGYDLTGNVTGVFSECGLKA